MADTPTQTMIDIIERRQAHDFDGAAANYAEDATIVAAPGKPAYGRQAVRDGFAALAAAFPVFSITARTVIENGDLALHHSAWNAPDQSAWNATGPAGAPAASGRTADILQRQPDGNWLVLIDNPWGTALLDD